MGDWELPARCVEARGTLLGTLQDPNFVRAYVLDRSPQCRGEASWSLTSVLHAVVVFLIVPSLMGGGVSLAVLPPLAACGLTGRQT